MNRQSIVIPLILAGGAGTRLWPLSRGQSPKQFLRLGEAATLLHQTLERCIGGVFDRKPMIVGSTDNRGQLLEAVQEVGILADILLEPMRRNSCAAIVTGALRALERDADAVVLVLAADHHIPDRHAFQAAVERALPAALAGQLVTFGVKPRHAATGYGYILPNAKAEKSGVFSVQQFVEKPDPATASRYMKEGYLWNSGNFLFLAKTLIEEVRRNAPEVLAAVELAMRHASRDEDFIRLAVLHFAAAPKISMDYAVMEKTSKASVLPVEYGWNDIGTWDAVSGTLAADTDGNAIIGRGVVMGGRNVTVHSETLLTTVIGCDDLIVVTTRDAVLVARKGSTESVKALVDRLKDQGYAEADGPLPQFDLP
jgi:mannose-1-phosphate guanylyltransferase / mannose-6-phosphate isomerase